MKNTGQDLNLIKSRGFPEDSILDNEKNEVNTPNSLSFLMKLGNELTEDHGWSD